MNERILKLAEQAGLSEGIKLGRVQTIVVPSNFNALMMNK